MRRACAVASLLAAACTTISPKSPEPATAPGGTAPAPAEQPTQAAPVPAPVPSFPAPPAAPPVPAAGKLVAARWDTLPGWKDDDLRDAWPALLASCFALKGRADWQRACWAATEVTAHDAATLRRYFESNFQPYLVMNANGSEQGLVTGYYEPLLHGSRNRTETYRYPIYGVPEDLVTIDLGDLYPELKGQRVRGRLDGKRVVPYYSRGEIDGPQAPLRGREILWVDDPVQLFFLHIQGSGRVRLDTGETVRVAYGDHNGHPFRSVGRMLVERGELTLDKASMQGIQGWARQHPDRLPQLLAENPAYVFFRELPDNGSGPNGTLGAALTAGRSIAVDPSSIPLGAPVFLATTWPGSATPLNRLVFAQDTGAAIKGPVRADFFWGFGEDAGQLAGRMRQPGRMWLLYPKPDRAGN